MLFIEITLHSLEPHDNFQFYPKDFSIGIEKYSKGMVLITDPGIYQVSAIFDTVSIEKREGHMNAVFGHDCNYFEVHKIH